MQTAQVIPFRFESIEVRAFSDEAGEPWFCAADVCSALGYANTSKAISDNCRVAGVTSSYIRSGGQGRSVKFINEGNLYRLIIKSRKEEAERFEAWVCDEVLPSIRKTGRYEDTDNRMATLVGQTIGTDGFHMLGAVVKGKVSSLPAAIQRRATSKIWSQTHAAFGVRSAADIPADQLDSARNFIAAYALEGEWLPKQEPAGVVVLDVYAAQHVYLLMSRIASMNKHRDNLGSAARALDSKPLMSVYSQLLESRSSFGYLDTHIGKDIYNAYRSLGVMDGGYAMGSQR